MKHKPNYRRTDRHTPPAVADRYLEDQRVVFEAVRDATVDELRPILKPVVDRAADADGDWVFVRQSINANMVARLGLEDGFGDPTFDDEPVQGPAAAYHVPADASLEDAADRLRHALRPQAGYAYVGP